MPTLALYDTAGQPRGSHRVEAPGGYEWWHFDAEDAARDIRVSVDFFDGCPLHPGYLRAYARYRRRPTRVKPPLPRDFPCVGLAVYEGGKIRESGLIEYPAGAFRATVAGPSLTAGPSAFRRNDDGVVFVEARTPSAGVSLAFRPVWPACDGGASRRRFLPRETSGADHFWIADQPMHEVEGTVRLTGPGGERAVELRGRGYHDRAFGSGPIGPGLRRWTWGRVLTDDAAVLFRVAVPLEADAPEAVCLVEVDRDSARDVAAARFVQTADEIRVGPALRLTNPRVLERGRAFTRVTYDAQIDGKGRIGTAYCETWFPERLRSPLTGRMIERSIRRERISTPPA